MPRRGTASQNLPALFLFLLLLPDPASAENILTRAGSTIAAPFVRLARALIPDGAESENLDRALEAYANGRYFTAYIYASRLRAQRVEPFRDEANLLVGLAATAAGMRDQAVSALRALLEAPRVSPYYAVALAALIELESSQGNTEAAANAAERYFASLWRQPRSKREAGINALFLEHGNLSPSEQPIELHFHIEAEDLRQKDRPADRAAYQAGLALLRAKRFDRARVAFEPLEPESPYFPYARYGLGQALYAAGHFADAQTALSQVFAYPPHGPGEAFLRHRAALLIAQMLYELDDDSDAIKWLRRISGDGPFALHAVLLSAEIHASRDKHALALVYLKDRPTAPAEPKLVAHAAATDASLHREIGDLDTAVKRLEGGIAVLRKYSAKLEALTRAERQLDTIRSSLAARQEESERRREAWRREALANAVPALVSYDVDPGWLSRLIASWLETDSREDARATVPIIYYPDRFDPFGVLPEPTAPEVRPPSDDGVFPALFRHSLSHALEEALERELDLRASLTSADPVHARLLVLDTALRLRELGRNGHAELFEALGLEKRLRDRISAGGPRGELVEYALRDVGPGSTSERRDRVADLTRRAIERWQEFERELILEAARQEQRTVQEALYGLEFDLSQTFTERKLRGRSSAERK